MYREEHVGGKTTKTARRRPKHFADRVYWPIHRPRTIYMHRYNREQSRTEQNRQNKLCIRLAYGMPVGRCICNFAYPQKRHKLRAKRQNTKNDILFVYTQIGWMTLKTIEHTTHNNKMHILFLANLLFIATTHATLDSANYVVVVWNFVTVQWYTSSPATTNNSIWTMHCIWSWIISQLIRVDWGIRHYRLSPVYRLYIRNWSQITGTKHITDTFIFGYNRVCV